MDFNLHSELEPCQNQCIPKDLLNDPTNPFTSSFCATSHPLLPAFGELRNTEVISQPHTSIWTLTSPGIFQPAYIRTGNSSLSGTLCLRPQFTFESSHSSWFKSTLSLDLTTKKRKKKVQNPLALDRVWVPQGSVSVLHYRGRLVDTGGGKVNLGTVDQHFVICWHFPCQRPSLKY